MFKKVLAFSLTLLMLFGLVACGGSSGSGSSAEKETETNTGNESETEVVWPEYELSLVVGFGAGGGADSIARALAKEMSVYLDTDVAVTNVTGANGSIAGVQVLDTDDEHTILGATPFNPGGWRVLDYADVSWEDYYGFYAATAPYVLFVAGNSPINTTQELLDLIKAEPGKHQWGTGGLGTLNHLTGQMFLDMVGQGQDAVAIPYSGAREGATKVMAGESTFSWCGLADVYDLAVSGDIKILSIAREEDLTVEKNDGTSYVAPSLSDLHSDLDSLQNLLYWGILIPRTTRPEVVSKFNEAFLYACEQPDFLEMAAAQNFTVDPTSGEDADRLSAYLESIYAWGLYDNGLAAEGVSPEDFGIPRVEDFVWPSELSKSINPWP